MGKKLMITPTCETPEQGITGVLVNGNIFVPTYEMPTIIERCDIQQKTVQPSMQVSWSDWTSFNGIYVEKGTYDPSNGNYNYFQKSDNSGWYIARYSGNKSRWCFVTDDWGGMNTSNGLCDYYCLRSDSGTELQCPYDGYYDDEHHWSGGLTNATADVMPRTVTCLVVNDCGPNATYVWNYLVALNSNEECNIIVMNKKTNVPYIDASVTKTANPVVYIADVSITDNVLGENLDVITRCFFSKPKVIRYSTKRYQIPTYTILPTGETFAQAIDYNSVVDNGKAHCECSTSTDMFYIKRYCYSGCGYRVYGSGEDYGSYRDKKAGLMDESGNYVQSLFDSDPNEEVNFTASYTGYYYYVCQTYSNGNWNNGNGLDVYWTVTSGTEG